MSEELVGNVLITQSGKNVAVSNAILAGAVSEALNHDVVEEIYGCLGGIAGLLNEDFIDLAEESQQTIRGLQHTPGAALGTSTYPLQRPEDLDRAVAVLEAHNIRFAVFIGDNELLEAARTLVAHAQSKGYQVSLIAVPQKVANDLPVLDHSPGYGSALKTLVGKVMETALDIESYAHHDLVSILEVDNGNSGWLAAGSLLAKRRNQPDDAPHLVYMPEAPFNNERFLDSVRAVLKRNRYCLIVTNRNLVDDDGNYITTEDSQPGDGAADYMASILDEHLGMKTQIQRMEPTIRIAANYISKTDRDEALECGAEAIKATIAGKTGECVTILRGESEQYSCQYSLAPLDEVLNGFKTLPQTWITEEGAGLSYQFFRYSMPLIQGEVALPFESGHPHIARLSKTRVERKLEAHALA